MSRQGARVSVGDAEALLRRGGVKDSISESYDGYLSILLEEPRPRGCVANAARRSYR